VAKLEGLMHELVSRLLVTASSLGLNQDIPKKIINGQHKQRSSQHTQTCQKIFVHARTFVLLLIKV
jgi:hypothetical protein